jgi:hypothetical protein
MKPIVINAPDLLGAREALLWLLVAAATEAEEAA